MKKNHIFILASVLVCYSCKSKKTLTFEQKYAKADKLYNRKKFDKAAEIYEDIYPDVPNKFDSINILKKLADCLYQEKKYKRCLNDYEKLYEVVNDDDRLFNGFRRCNCLYNIIEKNNKRDISRADSLVEMIDDILDEYSQTTIDEEKKILEDLQKIKKTVSGKIIEKKINIIKTYEKLEMFDSVVVYAKNFLTKYPKSDHVKEICHTLLKSQFLSAETLERKNKKNEHNNVLFEKWKDIILTFNEYKDYLQENKEAENLYNQALKKMNL